MNRLYHLKETLPRNLADNAIDNVEFVVLDYNSSDGLETWMKQQFHTFGAKVAYFKTTEAAFYQRSHSRNMAFRLATGDILCNLDADNYAGEHFAEYLISVFEQNPEIFVSPENDSLSDTFGKICVRKSHFYDIGGYDEAIKGYGFEDNDLKNRLTNLGLTAHTFSHPEFLQAITHPEEERIKNEYIFKQLNALFVEKISFRESKLILQFKDNTYESARVIDTMFSDTNIRNTPIIHPLEILKRYYIAEGSIENGIFSETIIKYASPITKPEILISTINFYSQLSNKRRFMANFQQKRIKVNGESFGCGIVFKNFDNLTPILLT